MIEITEEEKYRRKVELLKRALAFADAWDKEDRRGRLCLVICPNCSRDPEESR